MAIDQLQIDFDPSQLLVLNLILGALMFGVALELRPSDFRALARQPRAPVLGLLTQFLLLPAMTFVITLLIEAPPSIELGMLLVSACPGGNTSNFMTAIARGRVATSVGMTAVSSTGALLMVPLNLTFWGGLNPDTAPLIEAVSLDPWAVLTTVAIVLAVPVLLGMSVGTRYPQFSDRVQTPVRWAMLFFLALLIAVAFRKNFGVFIEAFSVIFFPVVGLNAAAFVLGFAMATVARLDPRDRRAVTIEVGIQNTALGLVVAFQFFAGLGGLTAICAWWGIWHLIAGLALATVWSQIPLATEVGN